jgi:hypothetical protein
LAEVLELLRTPLHPAGLRDEIAMAALNGILSRERCGYTVGMASRLAYGYADAMLERRASGKAVAIP